VDEVADVTDIPSLPKTGAKVRKIFKGHISKIYALHWASNAPYFVSASQDGKLIIWNAVTANKINAISLKSSWVMSCAFSPSGKFVASGGLDNMCTVYNASKGKPEETQVGKYVSELTSHSGYISCCRFLNDEKILTSSGDSTCLLWDIEKNRPITRYEEHASDVLRYSIKPSFSCVGLSSCIYSLVSL
jgi:guanine nucleotide-binding protein G(I)/G(S)/G(T) subunit beta-1